MSEEKQTSGMVPLHEKIDMIRRIAIFPALTVMIFLRRGIGFRLLKTTWLVVLAIIMIVGSLLFPAIAEPHGTAMILFALAMLGWGFFQRWQRWCDICSGVRWHTYCPGVSYLEYIPWPAFIQSHRRINRFLDPLVVAIVGLIAGLLLSHLLGTWIEFAGLFLFVYEQDLYEGMLNHRLDTLDGLIAAEVQQETVKHFQQAQPTDKVRSMEATAGIPTGIAPDIDALLAKRQAEFAAAHPAPDNLAKEEPPTVAPAAPAPPAPSIPKPPAAPDNLAAE